MVTRFLTLGGSGEVFTADRDYFVVGIAGIIEKSGTFLLGIGTSGDLIRNVAGQQLEILAGTGSDIALSLGGLRVPLRQGQIISYAGTKNASFILESQS